MLTVISSAMFIHIVIRQRQGMTMNNPHSDIKCCEGSELQR